MCETIDKIIYGLNSHFPPKHFKAGYDEEGNLYFRCNMTEILFDKNGNIVEAKNSPFQNNTIK